MFLLIEIIRKENYKISKAYLVYGLTTDKVVLPTYT